MSLHTEKTKETLTIMIALLLYNRRQHIFCKNQMVNSLRCVSHTICVPTKTSSNWTNQWATVSQLHLLYGGEFFSCGTTDVWGWRLVCYGLLSWGTRHRGMFISTLDLHPLEVRSIPQVGSTKIIPPGEQKCPEPGKLALEQSNI